MPLFSTSLLVFPMSGNFFLTAARTRASTGLPLARLSAFAAWLLSLMGYLRCSGMANDRSERRLRCALVSLAI